MTIAIETIDQQLDDLRARQKKVEEAWSKTGNRGLLQFFVEIIPRLFEAERCSIFVLDPNQNSVWVQCGTGVEERQIEVPTAESVVGEVISSGKPVSRSGMENKIGMHEKVDKETSFVTHNVLCVPIFSSSGSRVVGAIQVLNKRWGDFKDEDQETLEKFAFHLQANIENIFLRQEWGKFSVMAREKIKELEEKKARLLAGEH